VLCYDNYVLFMTRVVPICTMPIAQLPLSCQPNCHYRSNDNWATKLRIVFRRANPNPSSNPNLKAQCFRIDEMTIIFVISSLTLTRHFVKKKCTYKYHILRYRVIISYYFNTHSYCFTSLKPPCLLA